MQMPPFVEQLPKTIALLPSVQPMLHLFLFLFFASLNPIAFRTCREFPFKGIKHLRKVIVELRASECDDGGLDWIREGGHATTGQNCIPLG